MPGRGQRLSKQLESQTAPLWPFPRLEHVLCPGIVSCRGMVGSTSPQPGACLVKEQSADSSYLF